MMHQTQTAIYQFTWHDNLPKLSPIPEHKMFTLFQKLEWGETPLTREEKDYIADHLYGIFGAGIHLFKYMGFAAPFNKVLPRFLVKQHRSWNEYYAPDKTSLRKAIHGEIIEIVKA